MSIILRLRNPEIYWVMYRGYWLGCPDHSFFFILALAFFLGDRGQVCTLWVSGLSFIACLDSILKNRDVTLPTKIHIVKAMVFPVVMYGCDSWTIKKAERWRIDAFELWCWRRLLRVPWTTSRSNQSTLKEISPEYSLEGLMLKLKLQYFGHLVQRTDLLEKTLILGRIEGRRGRGWDDSMASLTWWTWVWASSRSWWWTWRPGVLQSMGSQSQTWLNNWTDWTDSTETICLSQLKVNSKFHSTVYPLWGPGQISLSVSSFINRDYGAYLGKVWGILYKPLHKVLCSFM